MLAHELKIGKKRSIGYAVAKADRTMIYAFRCYGKLYWCGDYETLRTSKSEAFADARARMN